MNKLAVALRFHVTDKMNNDPGWKKVLIIYFIHYL